MREISELSTEFHSGEPLPAIQDGLRRRAATALQIWSFRGERRWMRSARWRNLGRNVRRKPAVRQEVEKKVRLQTKAGKRVQLKEETGIRCPSLFRTGGEHGAPDGIRTAYPIPSRHSLGSIQWVDLTPPRCG